VSAVVFDRKTGEGERFQARQLLRPSASLAVEVRPVPVTALPVFLTPRDFFRHQWIEMLQLALTPYPRHLRNVYSQLFRQLPVRPGRFALRPVALSLGLHFLVLLCVPFIFSSLPLLTDENTIAPINRETTVYYRFPTPKQRAAIPTIRPRGPGAIPGSGALPERSPMQGARKALGTIFAVSHPKLPDNDHQTILQSQSAPELRIKTDLKLPNLIAQNRTAPKIPLNFHSNRAGPLAPSKKENVLLEPNLRAASSTPEIATMISTTDHQPRIAVPIGAAPAPNLPSMRTGTAGDPAAPEIGPGGGTANQGLLVLGTQPGELTNLVGLPPGNRYGQFSIAPGGGGGSPGGSTDGVVSGGKSGGTAGGSESVGVGSGSYGGGGGDTGTSGFVSLRGTGGAPENLGELNPGLIESMVFALPKITGPRHPGIVIAAGPIGGGGLEVYGALHCGKIYTVLLPMSGKNWTLQFCQTPGSETIAPAQTRSSVVHMDAALMPPEAETRFDFKRPPIPAEKIHKLIILEGTILPEGTVQNLKVHEGLAPAVDAAALRAFSQWTFKPAMRAGKPVSVDVLVGIPAVVKPSVESDVPTKIAGSKSVLNETGKDN
jgi:hypothetical protein